MAWVYILQSIKGRFYVGSTTNLEQRLEHHRFGATPSTKRLGACTLVFSQEYETLPQARLIERKLKKLKRKDYLKKIITDGYINMSSQE